MRKQNCLPFRCVSQIRLGLEEGLDVSYFNSLMYTAADMEKRRTDLREHPGYAVCGEEQQPVEPDESEPIRITLADENTAAYVDLCTENEENLRVAILKALHSHGITYGIRYDAIERLAAEGKPRTHVARTPKLMENGNVDYRNVEWFEQVEKGQKLAYYHRATTGKKE